VSTFTIIVPVYKNASSLDELLDQLGRLEFPEGIECRTVFVVDGSPDDSESILRAKLASWSRPATLVVLSRNFGSFAAIRAGLEHADGDYFAVLAADLQEPPELLVRFAEELVAGDVDLVLGRRDGRADPFAVRTSSRLFWSMYRRFVQPSMPAGGVDVFGCNRAVREAILDMREANSSLVGLLLWVGFRRREVGYERKARYEGKSSWTFAKRVRYMSDSIFSFTDLPIRILLGVGFLGSFVVTVVAAMVVLAWAFGDVDVPGYTPLMLSILFVGGVLTFGLGIVGSYVWRTYDNTKRRPLTLSQSVERYGPT
jgi:glycosyltransferase involved in cell wall biosynthesis